MEEDLLTVMQKVERVEESQSRLLKWLVGVAISMLAALVGTIVGATWWASSVNTNLATIATSTTKMADETIPEIVRRQTKLEMQVGKGILPAAEERLGNVESEVQSLREELIENRALKPKRRVK